MISPFYKSKKHGSAAGAKGFSLVELLVAIGVFSFIMTISAGAYLVMIQINQRAQATALVADTLSFVFENMTREIRTGLNYGCPTAPTNCTDGTTFSFTNTTGQNIVYTRVAPAGQNGYITEAIDTDPPLRLTDSSINITSLKFTLVGAGVPGSGDYVQPYVQMFVSGVANAGPGQSLSFSLQTSATMRGIDI
jgi:prepilin-type N-terminal cleavage/methylation domain-containing protein